MNYISRLINVIRDRSLSVEERVSIMFISVGVIAALVGELICVACHASIYSTIAILFISVTALISIGIGIRRADIDFIRIAMVIVVSVMMLLMTNGVMYKSSGRGGRLLIRICACGIALLSTTMWMMCIMYQ